MLGSILLNEEHFIAASAELEAEDFTVDAHRKIFTRMAEIHAEHKNIDRVTVASEIQRHNELGQIGGLSYLISLDDGLPAVPKVDSYIAILKEKTTLRQIIFAAEHMKNRAMEGAAISAEILSGASSTITRLEVRSSKQAIALKPGQIIELHPGGTVGFLDQSGKKPGLRCGFKTLDELLLGFQPGDTHVIAGITGSGKSALTANIATGLALNGHPGLYIPIEMTREQMMARLVCAEAEVPLKYFLKGELMGEQRRKIAFATEKIRDIPLYFDDTPSLTVTGLASRVDRAVHEFGIEWFALDYLQILDFANTKGIKFDNENHAIGYASRLCKLLCMRHKISGFVLSQLRRATGGNKEYDRPRISELRGSGSIENDASVIIFAHRPEMGKPGRPELKGVANIIVAKNRNGEKKDLAFQFRGSCVKFVDEEEDPADQVDD